MATAATISGTPGEVYQREMVPAIFARWAPDLIELAGLAPGERVLDVACGTGVVARLAAERVGSTGKVTGLDLNPTMLAAARAQAAPATVEWVEGSALAVPLPDESVDTVLCQQGLQFFPDRAAALREMRRVLVPGGRLVLSVWQSVDRQPAFHALEQALARRIGAQRAALPPFAFGDRAALRAVVTEAGFREVRVRVETKTTRFPSPQHFVRVVAAGGPTILELLAGQGADGLETLVQEVAGSLAAWVDDDGLAFPQISHILAARR
jgi:ubiquinone/menaquinone biosynthesis C-methylase UbiE